MVSYQGGVNFVKPKHVLLFTKKQNYMASARAQLLVFTVNVYLGWECAQLEQF